MTTAGSVPVLVLAAGGSSRFGSPKQLARWQGTSLLRHAAGTAIDAALGPVIVMLGAQADQLRPELDGLAVATFDHSAWGEGIGGTIAAGVMVQRARWPMSAAIIVMACDQPRVTAAHLVKLAGVHREKRCDAVASAYAGTIGIPALFDAALSARLAALQGDHGAKRLLESLQAERVELPGGEVDIDRPADLGDTR